MGYARKGAMESDGTCNVIDMNSKLVVITGWTEYQAL
jgi:hypothetical protein